MCKIHFGILGGNIMNQRFKTCSIVVLLGVIYYIFIQFTGFMVPCVFRKITGLRCPGCGISGLFICLFSLDFIGAFNSNPFIFVTFPYLIIELLFYDIINKKYKKINDKTVIVYLFTLILFGIIRNI